MAGVGVSIALDSNLDRPSRCLFDDGLDLGGGFRLNDTFGARKAEEEVGGCDGLSVLSLAGHQDGDLLGPEGLDSLLHSPFLIWMLCGEYCVLSKVWQCMMLESQEGPSGCLILLLTIKTRIRTYFV